MRLQFSRRQLNWVDETSGAGSDGHGLDIASVDVDSLLWLVVVLPSLLY